MMASESVYLAATKTADLFQHDKTSSGRALYEGFQILAEQCRSATPSLGKIEREAPKYDLDENTPGNGYRSFLIMYDAIFRNCHSLCQTVTEQKNSVLFPYYSQSYVKDLNSWNEIFAALQIFLEHLNTLIEWNKSDATESLFPSQHHSSQELLEKAQSVQQHPFYGRHAAFQFCPSIAKALNSVLTVMAGYSDYYFSNSKYLWRVTKSLFMGTQYFFDSDHRSQRIVNASQFATVDFCKSFWCLADSELMKRVPNRLCPSVQVNKLILIPSEPLQLELPDGKIIDIPLPTAHGPPSSIQVRLLIASKSKVSDSLLIHCHGGGFVANSSQSHESYLRFWAVSLGIPILSIDYSLAPEFPYPRQLQEILYAYTWALKNMQLLGTTGKKIVFAGDSAGANLMISSTLWMSSLNMPLPMGVFLAYVPLLVKFVPSPSRLLCLTDPLLPFGFMMRCLNAYAGQDMGPTSDGKVGGGKSSEAELDGKPSNRAHRIKRHTTVANAEQLDHLKSHSPSDELDLFFVPNSPLLSPFLASDAELKKLPPISLMSVELDPCLDDSVEFAKRCRRLGKDVTLDILPGLSHGFLNFALTSPEAKEGSRKCVKRIKELFNKDF